MEAFEEPIVLDPTRHPPALLAYFLNHRKRWERGEIRLHHYLERYYETEKREARPLWYPEPLGRKVIVDKAQLFEQLRYRPSEPSCLAHASLAKIRVYSGGSRAGKSMWGGYEFVPLVLSPDTRLWIVAPEYEQGRKEFEYILEAVETDEVRKDWGAMLKGGRIRNNPKNGDMELRLKWGDAGDSFVRVKSAERKKSLLSESLDGVMVCEASQINRVVWSRYLQMRLTDRRGIAIFPSSPDGTGWFDDLWRSGIRGDPGVFSINADTRMNPTLDINEIGFWTDPRRMSDEDFEEQVKGRPTPKHGRVFKNFDRTIHVTGWNPSWPRTSWGRGRSFDFGYKDPYVVLWIAKEGETFYVYREFYRRFQLTNEVVEYIAEVEGWETEEDNGRTILRGETGRRERIDLVSTADWDASEREDLSRHGIKTRRARKGPRSVLPGIRTVEEYLRPDPVTGKPRLFISPKCPKLIEELEVYQWAENGQPRDRDNHAIDALRYFIHTLNPHRSSKMEIRTI